MERRVAKTHDLLMGVIRVVMGVGLLLLGNSEHASPAPQTHRIALVSFLGYSALVCVTALWPGRLNARHRRWAHWVDVCAFTLLYVTDPRWVGVYFFGYVLAAVGAAIHTGAATAVRVALLSGLLG